MLMETFKIPSFPFRPVHLPFKNVAIYVLTMIPGEQRGRKCRQIAPKIKTISVAEWTTHSQPNSVGRGDTRTVRTVYRHGDNRPRLRDRSCTTTVASLEQPQNQSTCRENSLDSRICGKSIS